MRILIYRLAQNKVYFLKIITKYYLHIIIYL